MNLLNKIIKKNKEQKIEKKDKEIKKSKETIKKYRIKIKEEKKQQKKLKQEHFYTTKFGQLLKKIFLIKDEKTSIKRQILLIISFILTGVILCLIVLFILTGGKNYFKIYNELSDLIETYDTISNEYYKKVDKKELIDIAISSMLEKVGDNYTNYNDQESTTTFIENVSGTYEGIGATVTMDQENHIVVAEVFEESPSEKAGLKEKDIITKIDGKDFNGKNSQDMADYVKNSTKSQVKVTVLRDGKEKTLTITRKKIEVPTISSKIINENNKKIGYINISIFTSTTDTQFEEKLKKLEKDKIDALIIDVRDNTGGYLSTVTNISSLFLEKGKTIYQLEDSKGTEKIKDETKEQRSYKIAVLVNENSASASEILASAIKESYNGRVVGTKTYGKGTVQKTKKLKDGSMIKYTTQKWLTPKGTWINEKGVTPTDTIKLDTSKEEDNQLNKAVELLLSDISK